LAATLGFLETQTLDPDALTREHAETVYAAGVSREALETASTVCALFNMITRLADSLGWDVPAWERLKGRAPAMLEGGYLLGAIRKR
jgi:hypothetical protein